MHNKLYIPKTIKIGFQNREDTYTGKLAYVVYYDEKNKLRKEASWNSWRDKKIEPIEYENKPMNGFVLNKGIHRYSDWGTGRHVIRIHDPREFEFEITVDNLTGILTHSDVSKREITEQMVFAWYGTELVLLPVNSEAYQQSVEYTDKQSNKVSTKSLVPGRMYAAKKSDDQYMYIGFYECFNFSYVDGTDYNDQHQKSIGKKHVFYKKEDYYGNRFTTPSVSTFFSHEISTDLNPEFAQKCSEFFETTMGQRIVGVRFKDTGTKPFKTMNHGYAQYWHKVDDSSFCQSSCYDHTINKAFEATSKTIVAIDPKYGFRYSNVYARNNYWDRSRNALLSGVCGITPSINVILTLENGKEITYDKLNRH